MPLDLTCPSKSTGQHTPKGHVGGMLTCAFHKKCQIQMKSTGQHSIGSDMFLKKHRPTYPSSRSSTPAAPLHESFQLPGGILVAPCGSLWFPVVPCGFLVAPWSFLWLFLEVLHPISTPATPQQRVTTFGLLKFPDMPWINLKPI